MGYKYSLRSTPTRANVATIAKYYGGGGHACASGYASNTDECIKFADVIYDRAKSYRLLQSITVINYLEYRIGVLKMDNLIQLEHLTKYLAQDNNFIWIYNQLYPDNQIASIDIIIGYI